MSGVTTVPTAAAAALHDTVRGLVRSQSHHTTGTRITQHTKRVRNIRSEQRKRRTKCYRNEVKDQNGQSINLIRQFCPTITRECLSQRAASTYASRSRQLTNTQAHTRSRSIDLKFSLLSDHCHTFLDSFA